MNILDPNRFFHDFPLLHPDQDNFAVTSSSDPSYNCIAWAAGDTENPWWPHEDTYWPDDAPDDLTLTAFEEMFRTLGYESCPDATQERGFEKIAVYVQVGQPTHAARQLPDGRWSSKIGDNVDIAHELPDLECNLYGKVQAYMRRPLVGGDSENATFRDALMGICLSVRSFVRRLLGSGSDTQHRAVLGTCSLTNVIAMATIFRQFLLV